MLGSGELSKTQIDRLGDRLRKGDIHEDDLRLLDIYSAHSLMHMKASSDKFGINSS